MDSSIPVNDSQPASNYDEIFMQRSLLFADSLKELKNIREQLYSAAEYFESSYHRNDHDQLLLESLKDYVDKAFVSTVDHLGSVAYKVNTVLDENVNEVSETKLRLNCIEQRLRTCQDHINLGGFSQQTLLIETPKYHKHYLVQDGCFPEAVQAMEEKRISSFLRRGHSRVASTEFASSPGDFLFTKTAAPNKGSEKRSMSKLGFPLKRSGSVSNQYTSPSFPVKRSGSIANRSISPNSFNTKERYPSEPWRSDSLHIHPARDRTKEMEVYSKKTRSLFKALLSIHKSKNDSGLYR